MSGRERQRDEKKRIRTQSGKTRQTKEIQNGDRQRYKGNRQGPVGNPGIQLPNEIHFGNLGEKDALPPFTAPHATPLPPTVSSVQSIMETKVMVYITFTKYARGVQHAMHAITSCYDTLDFSSVGSYHMVPVFLRFASFFFLIPPAPPCSHALPRTYDTTLPSLLRQQQHPIHDKANPASDVGDADPDNPWRGVNKNTVCETLAAAPIAIPPPHTPVNTNVQDTCK